MYLLLKAKLVFSSEFAKLDIAVTRFKQILCHPKKIP